MNFFRKMQIKIKNRWSDNKFKKNFLLCLFVLTIACLWFPLFILAEFETTPTSFTENMWVFYLFLPIPILSIILGIITNNSALIPPSNEIVEISNSLLTANNELTLLIA